MRILSLFSKVLVIVLNVNVLVGFRYYYNFVYKKLLNFALFHSAGPFILNRKQVTVGTVPL